MIFSMLEVSTAVEGVASTNLAGSVPANHLSFIGLFLHADPIVMIIMIMLIAMSVISWGIIFEKIVTFRNNIQRADKFEHDFWSAEALDKFLEKVKKRKTKDPFVTIFLAAMEEWTRSKNMDHRPGSELRLGLKERITQMMSVARNRELDKLERGLGFLATAGSSAPFIGLLGTVIGIMNSFRAIAGQQNTSLAVVAPGIAEALFATAIGLFVAIPAVIAYNKLSSELGRYAGRLEDFCTEFNTLFSRQIDNGGA